MSLVTEESRRVYLAQRGVSQGASITLTAGSAGYSARHECALKCAEILGTRHFRDNPAKLTIPTEDLHRAITKLAESHSVALVDTVTDDNGTRLVLVWRILPTRSVAKAVLPEVAQAIEKKEMDRLLVIAGNSQGASANVDDY